MIERKGSDERDEGPASQIHEASRHLHGLGGIVLGVLLLAAIVAALLHFADIRHVVDLAASSDPLWLALAVALQAGTYLSAATVWQQALRWQGITMPLARLALLSVAKLFSEKAVPSAGLGGTAFFVVAMGRRGVPGPQCFGALLTSLVSYYLAYIALALGAVLILASHRHISAWVWGVVLVFVAATTLLLIAVTWIRLVGRSVPAVLLRIPAVAGFVRTLGEMPTDIWAPSLLARAFWLQGLVFLLDATTLWALLHGIGAQVSWVVAFSSFMVASMVATVGIVPLGLGTFEAACVGMLSGLGLPVGTALTGTLLLRGFTLWLPMLPGLWLMRRELRSAVSTV